MRLMAFWPNLIFFFLDHHAYQFYRKFEYFVDFLNLFRIFKKSAKRFYIDGEYFGKVKVANFIDKILPDTFFK